MRFKVASFWAKLSEKLPCATKADILEKWPIIYL